MPRLYTDEGDPLDFCASCYRLNGMVEHDEHPSYEDEEYVCEDCGKELTKEDN